MIILILNMILVFVVDTLLVGIAFISLREKFNWKLSSKTCFFVLILIFALYDSYMTPMFLLLDATITIRNEAIIKAFDISPTFPLVELFDLNLFDFVVWCLQAFFAGLIGERLIAKKQKIYNKSLERNA